MYLHVYIYIYAQIHVYIYIYREREMYTHVYICTCVYIYICIYVGWHDFVSNATCLIRASSVLCVFRRVKDHHNSLQVCFQLWHHPTFVYDFRPCL